MKRPFDSFVILAGMRTGSNFLEANLNEYAGIRCHGELFNPHFIGHAGVKEALGCTLAQREAEPKRLLRAMREAGEGINGLRLFRDHDPRVFDLLVADPRCAKVVLTRNPVDSYISLKIAGETGQWRLGDLKHAKSARIEFDRREFLAYAAEVRAYNDAVLHRIQATGQTAFFLTYEDVGDLEVMNGLAKFLGSDDLRTTVSGATKKQNPEPREAKVTNPAEMAAALAELDPLDLAQQPVFEPKRGAAVPHYLAAAGAPLLFLPTRGGPSAEVAAWMEKLGGPPVAGFSQKSLRQWMRERPGFRSFVVLRHPALRLYEAFSGLVAKTDSQSEIRQILRRTFGLKLPEGADQAGWDAGRHRAAFLDFCRFVQGNLSGQTSVRTDPAWATQLATVQAFAQVVLPDQILREDELARDLPLLCAAAGVAAPAWSPVVPAHPIPLAAIHDAEVEAATRAAHQRDYLAFGFGDWRGA